MKATVRNITIKIFVFLLIGIMGIMITNQALFLHFHKLSDGTVVTHAHPYNKTQDSQPNKTHHHSNIEFLLIHNLEVLMPMVFFAIALISLIREIKPSIFLIHRYQLAHIKSHKGRAPPQL